MKGIHVFNTTRAQGNREFERLIRWWHCHWDPPLHLFIYLHVFVCGADAPTHAHAHGGQRTSCGSQHGPSTTWAQGRTELGSHSFDPQFSENWLGLLAYLLWSWDVHRISAFICRQNSGLSGNMDLSPHRSILCFQGLCIHYLQFVLGSLSFRCDRLHFLQASKGHFTKNNNYHLHCILSLCFLFWYRNSLYILGWPWTYDPPVSPPQPRVLGL